MFFSGIIYKKNNSIFSFWMDKISNAVVLCDGHFYKPLVKTCKINKTNLFSVYLSKEKWHFLEHIKISALDFY